MKWFLKKLGFAASIGLWKADSRWFSSFRD